MYCILFWSSPVACFVIPFVLSCHLSRTQTLITGLCADKRIVSTYQLPDRTEQCRTPSLCLDMTNLSLTTRCFTNKQGSRPNRLSTSLTGLSPSACRWTKWLNTLRGVASNGELVGEALCQLGEAHTESGVWDPWGEGGHETPLHHSPQDFQW